MNYISAKRTIDFIVSIFLILILFPIFISVSLLILINMGRPIFFTQLRPGLNGRPFCIIKFRTMLEDNKGTGWQSDRRRLTPLGKFLRSTSLDEIPELLNVIKGDMSIVGPRPLLMNYLPLYSARQALRHTVRPGLTGWAQVNGRNSISWDEKFELDVWYTENQTLLLDLKIMFRTAIIILKREGISAEGQATMPPFELNCIDKEQKKEGTAQ